jgi:hypothetical protein
MARLFLACWLFWPFASLTTAGITYDEIVDGDLSDDNLVPTSLGEFTLGANTISGNVRFSGSGVASDVDVFNFTVGIGNQLESIVLLDYSSSDNVAFIGINDATTFPYNSNELDGVNAGFLPGDAFLGGTVFGPINVGNDIQPQLGTAAGRGFTGALTAGDYAIFIQQKGAVTDYQFAFNISAVPEPSSLALCLLAAGLCRRRRPQTV